MIAAPFGSARLTMRATAIGDAAALHRAWSDAALMRYWSSAPHATMEESVAYLAARVDHDAWRGWTICRRDDNAIVGTLGATTRRSGVAEIGYMLIRDHWGQGMAREAVAALIDLLFAEGHRRIIADTDPDNAPSNALLARLGFVREGLLREEWETHIGLRDSVIWGLLRREWSPPTSSPRA